VVKTGVVIGPHPMAKLYKPNYERATLYAEEGGEVLAAKLLEKMGCEEIIFFACPFSHLDEMAATRVRFMISSIEVPCYQTLVATPVRLPAVCITEFI